MFSSTNANENDTLLSSGNVQSTVTNHGSVNTFEDSESDIIYTTRTNDNDYSVGTTPKIMELKGLEGGKAESIAHSSSPLASFNVICTVVGAGILQLPASLNQGGWIVLVPLVFFAVVAAYTAILIVKCFTYGPPRARYTYGDMGDEAFGKWGKIFCDWMAYINLLGSGTLYLILAGGNLITIFGEVPRDNIHDPTYSAWHINSHIGIALIAAFLWFHIFLKTLNEVAIVSAFNILVAAFLVLVVIIEIFTNPPTYTPKHQIISHSVLNLGGAFSSVIFSYGAHSVIPSIYETMKKKEQFNWMVSASFFIILFFYVPLSIIAYNAYGDHTKSPIYDNLCESGDCAFSESLGKYLVIVSITVHVCFTYALNLNPVERALETYLRVEEKDNAWIYRILLRTGVMGITVIIAESVPDFQGFLDLVSAISSSFIIFIIPCTCYLKIYWNTLSYPIISVNFTIIAISIIGSAFGAYYAILQIACQVFGECASSTSS